MHNGITNGSQDFLLKSVGRFPLTVRNPNDSTLNLPRKQNFPYKNSSFAKTSYSNFSTPDMKSLYSINSNSSTCSNSGSPSSLFSSFSSASSISVSSDFDANYKENIDIFNNSCKKPRRSYNKCFPSAEPIKGNNKVNQLFSRPSSIPKALIPSSDSLHLSDTSLDSYFKEPSPSDIPALRPNVIDKNIFDDTFGSPISKKMERRARSVCADRASYIRFYKNRSKPRRTHSMFQHPQEVVDSEVKEEEESTRLSSCLNNNYNSQNNSSARSDAPISFLDRDQCPIEYFSVESDPLKRIDGNTLCDIMDGKFEHLYSKHIIIDCRFDYEYEGGHIDSAININTHSELEKMLSTEQINSNFPPLLIFHCEFSSHRGPLMAMHLRKCDRELNVENYPYLNYPNILILEGGYKKYFKNWSFRCIPEKYIEMNDKRHLESCERELDRFRRGSKQLNKTQSYASSKASKASKSTSNLNNSFNSQLGFNKLFINKNVHLRSIGDSQLNISYKYPKIESLQQKSPLKLGFTNSSLLSRDKNNNDEWELEDLDDIIVDVNVEDASSPTVNRKRSRIW